jgi:hypothetical protein
MKIALYHNLPSGGGKRALYEMVVRLAAHHEIDAYSLSMADHDFCDIRPYCRRRIVFPFRPLPLDPPFGRLNQGILRRSAAFGAHQRQLAAESTEKATISSVHNCRIGQSPSLLRFYARRRSITARKCPAGVQPAARPHQRFSLGRRLGNLVIAAALYADADSADRRNVQAVGRCWQIRPVA